MVRWENANKFSAPFSIEGRTFFYRCEVDSWLAEKRERSGFKETFAASHAAVKR